MIVVVPPWAAAIVPVAKSSDAVVPPNGRSMCVWASIAPGKMYWPVASIVRSAWPSAARCDGSVSATMRSPSIHTSAAKGSEAVTTVPFEIRVRVMGAPAPRRGMLRVSGGGSSGT